MTFAEKIPLKPCMVVMTFENKNTRVGPIENMQGQDLLSRIALPGT